jgi:hypothetical protein
MRHLPITLGAALLTVCLFAGSGHAGAMPALSLDRSAIAGAPIEPVGYYRHWYGGYYPYRYYRPYGYYRPYHRYGYYYGYY